MFVSSALRAPASGRPWLICLDLQRDHVIAGRPRYAAADAEVADVCARVLGHARDERWRIVHSQVRQDRAEGAQRLLFDAPIEGLRPLITEPVFFRRELSAFANPGFAAELRGASREPVYLIGYSLRDTCLATALAGRDAGLDLTLVSDAVGAGEADGLGSAALAILQPLVGVTTSWRLLAHALEAMT